MRDGVCGREVVSLEKKRCCQKKLGCTGDIKYREGEVHLLDKGATALLLTWQIEADKLHCVTYTAKYWKKRRIEYQDIIISSIT